MTVMSDTGMIPEFTQGDRLRKARELTGLGQREFADVMGVSKQTVTNAENEHVKVRRSTFNLWAMASGISREWLEHGTAPITNNPDGGLSADTDNSSGSSGPPTSSYEGWRPALVAA